jgi:hypothetical protein
MAVVMMTHHANIGDRSNAEICTVRKQDKYRDRIDKKGENSQSSLSFEIQKLCSHCQSEAGCW